VLNTLATVGGTLVDLASVITRNFRAGRAFSYSSCIAVSVFTEGGHDKRIGLPLSPTVGYPHAEYSSAGCAGALLGHRARMTGWDVICTVALWVVLVVAAGTAMWLSLFFGFAADTCPTAGGPPVPL
jgi:hypothetical protein